MLQHQQRRRRPQKFSQHRGPQPNKQQHCQTLGAARPLAEAAWSARRAWSELQPEICNQRSAPFAERSALAMFLSPTATPHFSEPPPLRYCTPSHGECQHPRNNPHCHGDDQAHIAGGASHCASGTPLSNVLPATHPLGASMSKYGNVNAPYSPLCQSAPPHEQQAMIPLGCVFEKEQLEARHQSQKQYCHAYPVPEWRGVCCNDRP
mmetsp:Transcript_132196/g.254491  ORF Transcript_132196/g.254491 Transcript_132196/m.254491 type:complete len:207 (-) Transcript_132196:54-674(-)